MNFYNKLQEATKTGNDYLMAAPILGACMKGDITLEDYVAFLQQAYHHVKHTTPLLMATGSRIPESKEWLREALGVFQGSCHYLLNNN